MIAEVAMTLSYLTGQLAQDVLTMTKGRRPICGPGQEVALMLPSNVTTFAVVEIARAVLAGNSVCARLTRRAEQLSHVLDTIFAEVLPGRVRMEVARSGPEFVADSLASEAVPFLMVWGGEALGDELLARVSGGLQKKVVFEGPGKDPAVVLAGSDPSDVAAQLSKAKFFLAGQTCTAPENLIVHKSIHDPVVERLVAACRSAEEVPMLSSRVSARVGAQLTDALANGAELVCGGAVRGQAVQPTVVIGVRPEMQLFQDETFAPVFALCAFEENDEALTLARGTRFGLRAGVVGPSAAHIGAALRGAEYAEPVGRLVYGKYGIVADGELVHKDRPLFGGYGKSGWIWDRGQLLQGPKSTAREATVPKREPAIKLEPAEQD